ncbi:BlaR1 peptidase M56 [compost metagenome]
METFLIKSTIAMAALLGLYYLLFEREKMHHFNRFYLISSLMFSLAIPFITVITYVKHVKISGELATIFSKPTVSSTVTEQPIDYLFYIGWATYAIVTLVLIIRFIKNVSHFIKKASANPSIKKGTIRLVLLEEKTLPHTFLNYVFINRKEYETKRIEEELYTHEYTHVKQKHTFDILFIEALKTIFWFNPLLYFYKKAIQLNHEFLADKKVIDTTANTIYYQNLLLEKANVATTFSMASNLNFSLTKKRFIMMTKTTSTARAGFLKAAIVPVLATLMMLLCTKTVAQETNKTSEKNEQSVKATNLLSADKVTSLSADMIMEVATQDRLEAMQAMDAQVDSMKRVNPDAFSNDPEVRYKNTKFRFIDKEGRVTEKIGYKKLNKKEREKVAMDSTSIFGADILEFTETPKTTDPEFPGGLEAFYKAINTNFNIPKVDHDMTAKIYVSFVIEEDGSMSDIKVVRDPGYGLGKEAVRVIKLIKEKWQPETQDGKPVKTSYTLPITINIKV